MEEQKFDGYPMINESPLFVHCDLNIREKMTQPTPLQHTLCSMLHYRLKLTDEDGRTYDLMSASIHEFIIHGNDGIVRLGHDLDVEIKPILRNLSDLDKEIEQDGKKFVPAEDLSLPKLWWKIAEGGFAMIGEGNDGEVIAPGLMTYNRLYEWKFNVFGLEEGQFIPVDDKFNPY